jgi:hypothetical protein
MAPPAALITLFLSPVPGARKPPSRSSRSAAAGPSRNRQTNRDPPKRFLRDRASSLPLLRCLSDPWLSRESLVRRSGRVFVLVMSVVVTIRSRSHTPGQAISQIRL